MDYDNFVPKDFRPPEKLECSGFVFRKLCASDVYLDYMAVMSSIELIRETRGGTWPTPELTFEDDLIDLAWHQREFEHGHSFAFTVMSLDGTECLGCVYFYPPGFRKPASDEADVDVSFWVTEVAYKQGLYEVVKSAVKNWLTNAWPWRSPHWTNTRT